MFLQNAQPSSPETRRKTHDFELDVGQESIAVPHGFSRIARLWLISLRERPMFLAPVKKAEFAEMGRTYRVDREEMPVHLKGLPLYYCIENGEIKFWPVPAHKWKGVMEAIS